MHNKDLDEMQRRIFLGFLILFFVVVTLLGCAPTSVIIQKPSHLPSRQMIDEVPQLHQGRNECGPTSLAMVLNYYGVRKKKDELKADLRWDPEKGVSIRKMVRFPFEKYGFKFVIWKGSIEELMEQISQNRPVIVRQWINYDEKAKGKMGHWRVVIGYDHEIGRIYMRDPAITTGGFSDLSYKAFLDLWNLSYPATHSKNLMLVLIPEK